MVNYEITCPSVCDVDIYTIGHSTLTKDYFFDVLQKCGVNAVVDVRSDPHSMMASQFNTEEIHPFLNSKGCQYVYIGDTLGARQTDPNMLDEQGKVDFAKVIKTQYFHKGIERLLDGINKGFKIAIMCSERDPLTCHRFGLVSRALKAENVSVWHIIPETNVVSDPLTNKPISKIKSCKVVSQDDLEKELRIKYEKYIDCFFSTDSPLEQAYRKLNNDIGFSADCV